MKGKKLIIAAIAVVVLGAAVAGFILIGNGAFIKVTCTTLEPLESPKTVPYSIVYAQSVESMLYITSHAVYGKVKNVTEQKYTYTYKGKTTDEYRQLVEFEVLQKYDTAELKYTQGNTIMVMKESNSNKCTKDSVLLKTGDEAILFISDIKTYAKKAEKSYIRLTAEMSKYADYTIAFPSQQICKKDTLGFRAERVMLLPDKGFCSMAVLREAEAQYYTLEEIETVISKNAHLMLGKSYIEWENTFRYQLQS